MKTKTCKNNDNEIRMNDVEKEMNYQRISCGMKNDGWGMMSTEQI